VSWIDLARQALTWVIAVQLTGTGLITVELEGEWSGEEEANERLGGLGLSGASIMSRKTAGPVPCFYKGNRPYGLFDII
jgi:hypothetical protein